ncbi:MAG: HAD family hydrolase [Sphingomonas bacterium]|nr:HAD family hydrolase [Sphingomonas bacterium]
MTATFSSQGRPLLITDCDEVLLHMVSHFDAWLDEAHSIDFAFESGDFGGSMTDKATGETVSTDRVWPLLDLFFRGEMHRQTIVPGAVEALGRIGEVADIVILTNLGDEAHPWRVDQLAKHGIAHEVVTNSGGKGVPARAIIERYRATRSAFVDDLPVHHASVAKHAPEVHRLHMVAEPRLAPAVPAAPAAHVRIDDWPTATGWLLERLTQ